MKRMLCLILLLAVLLCGCQSAVVVSGDNETENNTEKVTETEVDVTGIQDPDVTLPKNEEETGGDSTSVGATGCVRVEYTGNVSSVRYITSVDQLPDHEALAAYDAAYFESKALLLVWETVSSGSVRVGIAAIEGGVVTLSHELSGDAGTADMATWLLWAEVEAGLDETWSVANPAVQSETHTH